MFTKTRSVLSPVILILGGSGGTGKIVSSLLLDVYPNCGLILAARTQKKLDDTKKELLQGSSTAKWYAGVQDVSATVASSSATSTTTATTVVPPEELFANKSVPTILPKVGARNASQIQTAIIDGTKVDSLIKVLKAGYIQPTSDGSEATSEGVTANEPTRIDMILVASPFVGPAPLQAAIQCGCHYMDINFNVGKGKILDLLKSDVEQSGIVAIPDAGWHPGLVAATARLCGGRLPGMQQCVIGGYLRDNWKNIQSSTEGADEFLSALMNGSYKKYIAGSWKDYSMMTMNSAVWKMHFDCVAHDQDMYPMYLDEVGEFVKSKQCPALTTCFFGMSGFGTWFDNVVLPTLMLSHYVMPKRATRSYLLWGLRKYASAPPYMSCIRCNGLLPGRDKPQSVKAEISHTDGYYLTAAAIVACIAQVIDGTIKTQYHQKNGSHFTSAVSQTEADEGDCKKNVSEKYRAEDRTSLSNSEQENDVKVGDVKSEPFQEVSGNTAKTGGGDGVYCCMGMAVDPERMIVDLTGLGITVGIKESLSASHVGQEEKK